MEKRSERDWQSEPLSREQVVLRLGGMLLAASLVGLIAAWQLGI